MKLSTKAAIRMVAVKIADMLSRNRFAGMTSGSDNLPYSIELVQPFKPSETLECKKHNLREAADKINRIVIRPGEMFSFWRAVGNPNNRKRFKEGRSINGGVLNKNIGGGLCQASGIIHHAAMIAGLKITERYNHSIDLYTDETRFAPLGTDATVVYGFKDLRLINTTSGNIAFKISIDDDRIVLKLESEIKLKVNKLNFEVNSDPDGHKHVIVRDEYGSEISQSFYRPLNH